MEPVKRRPVSEKEAAVLVAALTHAPVSAEAATIAAIVPKLHVVGRCRCGCDSVYFDGALHGEAPTYRVADGLGYRSNGEQTGIILWATAGQLAHLELYNFTEGPARLPEPASLCPFEVAVRE
jgi:hypothetical protein